MIPMKMSDEDGMDATSLYGRTHELNLRAFTAVEQKHVAFPNESCRRQTSGQRGYGGTGSEQDNAHNETKDCTIGTLPSRHNPQGADSREGGGRNRHTNRGHRECKREACARRRRCGFAAVR